MTQALNSSNAGFSLVVSFLDESWKLLLIFSVLVYPILTARLRFNRVNSMRKRFGYTTRDSFAHMTDSDAQMIQNTIGELEFPFTFEKALQFALFRTYGIPIQSSLLVSTSELSDVKTAGKRYVDTVVLIAEFMANAPTSTRARESIARMNCIHARYQRAGLIANTELLYTLSRFAVEPMSWIARYEWRELEDFEKCAIGTFWKSLGDAMGINYGPLKSYEKGWSDGLQWLEEIMEWGEGYEERFMVPDLNNRKTADQTTAILLWMVPSRFKQTGLSFVSALMDDRLRNAMMYEKPAQGYFTCVQAVLATRKFLLRHLALPRPDLFRNQLISRSQSKQGTTFSNQYVALPFYVPATLWNRWGPQAWAMWLMGLPIPGDEGDKYQPGGYHIAEVGPERMLRKGIEEFEMRKDWLKQTRTGGCPFLPAKPSIN